MSQACNTLYFMKIFFEQVKPRSARQWCRLTNDEVGGIGSCAWVVDQEKKEDGEGLSKQHVGKKQLGLKNEHVSLRPS